MTTTPATQVTSPSAPPWSDLALLATRQVLQEIGERSENARLALQQALRQRLEAAHDTLRPSLHIAQCGNAGLQERDARAVAFLRRLGQPASELRSAASRAAKEWIENARQVSLSSTCQPAHGSAPGEPDGWHGHFCRMLARVLWHGEVRSALAAARSKTPRQPAALALLFVNDYSTVYLNRRNTIRVHDLQRGRALAEILSPEGEPLAQTPVLNATLIYRAHRGAVALRSYLGQRVLRRVPTEVWVRQVAGYRNPRVLSWHGLEGFLEWMEVNSKFHADALDILRAGQDFRRTWADNGRPFREIGGLWTYNLNEDGLAAPGRHAHLELNVNRPLAPFFAKEDLCRRDERVLVPVVAMPPKVGSPNLWASAAAFQFLLVKALVEQRLDVIEHGGALLPPDTLDRIALEAGMHPEHLPRVLDRWLRDGDDGHAVLQAVEKDRFHLADNATYGAARRYIEQTGRLSIRRQKAARHPPARFNSRRPP